MKFFILLILVFSSSFALALTIDLEKNIKAKRQAPQLTGPVILDTRSSFDYSISHFDKSLPIRWDDFTQTEEPHKASLDPDVSLLARRLRIFGISPEREVIVLGLGVKGSGEEGRVAWMLAYLGVKNIKVMNFDQFQARKISGERPDVDEAPLWLPKINENLKIRISELEKKRDANTILIDVRSPDEFHGTRGHIPGAVNLPWTQFIDSDGHMLRPPEVVDLLEKNKIPANAELIFYGSGGVGSGYATFAAFQAGLRSRNFDGSFLEWAADKRLSVVR